jgi:hypothetical protein
MSGNNPPTRKDGFFFVARGSAFSISLIKDKTCETKARATEKPTIINFSTFFLKFLILEWEISFFFNKFPKSITLVNNGFLIEPKAHTTGQLTAN